MSADSRKNPKFALVFIVLLLIAFLPGCSILLFGVENKTEIPIGILVGDKLDKSYSGAHRLNVPQIIMPGEEFELRNTALPKASVGYGYIRFYSAGGAVGYHAVAEGDRFTVALDGSGKITVVKSSATFNAASEVAKRFGVIVAIIILSAVISLPLIAVFSIILFLRRKAPAGEADADRFPARVKRLAAISLVAIAVLSAVNLNSLHYRRMRVEKKLAVAAKLHNEIIQLVTEELDGK